jgi:IS4 transposase
MFNSIIERFASKSPVTVMVQALLERLLNPEVLDAWFEGVRDKQYTRIILFSSLVSMMLQVVCRVRRSVHAAYTASELEVSRVAVYDKLKQMELTTSQELVRHISTEATTIVQELGAAHQPLVPGYRVKIVDGNCIESSHHRLGVLRETKAAPLPGKSLVVFDPALELVIDLFPCEDGHAQERSLLNGVLQTVEMDDLWVADRNFCVVSFLLGVASRKAFFVIRQHQQMPYTPLAELKEMGQTESGTLYEQPVSITDGQTTLHLRRVVLKLNTPTRQGESELGLFTNLPPTVADAAMVAQLYRTRWRIETGFQKLEAYLHSEINTLGYPKAALFSFALALVAFNIYALVMAAIRAAHPKMEVEQEVSDYYIAQEISATRNGMLIAIPEADWSLFSQVSTPVFCQMLLYLARQINFRHFKKHKRGPKKKPKPKTQFVGKPHVSTAKLLAQNKQK